MVSVLLGQRIDSEAHLFSICDELIVLIAADDHEPFKKGSDPLEKFGDWQANFGYRYVESDAVVDGFTDSDFGGGGTNLQGYTLGGFMALSPAVRLGLRWMSADEVAGPPLSTDVLQLDLNAKF